MCATPWPCATPRVLRRAGKGQIKATRAANSLPLAQISYGVMTVMINSVTTALRSTHASTPILGEFSGVMWVIATVGQSVYSDRWSQPLRNIIGVLLSSDLTERKKYFYWPTHTLVSIHSTRKKKDYYRNKRLHSAFATATCLVR